MTVTSKLPSKYRKKQGDRKETEKRREGRILWGRCLRGSTGSPPYTVNELPRGSVPEDELGEILGVWRKYQTKNSGRNFLEKPRVLPRA